MERTKNNQCSLQLTSYLIFAFMIWRPGACIKQKNVQGYKRGRVSLFLFLPLLPPTTKWRERRKRNIQVSARKLTFFYTVLCFHALNLHGLGRRRWRNRVSWHQWITSSNTVPAFSFIMNFTCLLCVSLTRCGKLQGCLQVLSRPRCTIKGSYSNVTVPQIMQCTVG